jgi:hypothetical protein
MGSREFSDEPSTERRHREKEICSKESQKRVVLVMLLGESERMRSPVRLS